MIIFKVPALPGLSFLSWAVSVDNLTYTDFYTTAYKQHEIKAKDSSCFVLKLTCPE